MIYFFTLSNFFFLHLDVESRSVFQLSFEIEVHYNYFECLFLTLTDLTGFHGQPLQLEKGNLQKKIKKKIERFVENHNVIISIPRAQTGILCEKPEDNADSEEVREEHASALAISLPGLRDLGEEYVHVVSILNVIELKKNRVS